MRNVTLWIHIASAGVWLGAGVTQFVVSRIMRNVEPDSEAAWWKATVAMGTRLYTPAAAVALVTGIELVRSGPWGYDDAFVLIGIGAVIVGAILGIRYFGPQGDRIAKELVAGDSVVALRKRLVGVGLVDTTIVLFTTYAMVAKLGA